MSKWKYFESKSLGMRCAYRLDPYELWTEDKVKYDKQELEILKKSGGITKEIHEFKKMFKGRITEINMKEFLDRYNVGLVFDSVDEMASQLKNGKLESVRKDVLNSRYKFTVEKNISRLIQYYKEMHAS